MKTIDNTKLSFKKNLSGDLFGGLGGVLVALPSAIGFGLIIYAPLGDRVASQGAIAGIIGTIVLSILASVFGGTKRLITAPCAPAAAVMALFAGIFQVLIGWIGAGRFIKYIPYPVVAGYLSGVGCLIFIG